MEKSILHKMLTDPDGKESSKRIITFISFIMLAIAYFSNLFGNRTIEPFMFESIQWIVVAGLFANAVEKFTRKSQPSIPPEHKSNDNSDSGGIR